jgi:hypothetical protein
MGGETTADPVLVGLEVSILFLIFLTVSIVWECLMGVLTFLNNVFRGRKATWLTRVKEELLALGVVSLFLLFVQVRPLLAKSSTGCDLSIPTVFLPTEHAAQHLLSFQWLSSVVNFKLGQFS